jgi:hypothetical protein
VGGLDEGLERLQIVKQKARNLKAVRLRLLIQIDSNGALLSMRWEQDIPISYLSLRLLVLGLLVVCVAQVDAVVVLGNLGALVPQATILIQLVEKIEATALLVQRHSLVIHACQYHVRYVLSQLQGKHRPS